MKLIPSEILLLLFQRKLMIMVFGLKILKMAFLENGLVYYNTDGGGMTFSVANDDAFLEIVILRWVVE